MLPAPEPDCAPNGGEKRDDDVAEPARDLPWQPTASHAAAAPAHSVAHRTRPRNPCDLPKTLITVECGIAIDCPGHELVVREGLTVDLYSALSPEDRRVVDDDQGHTLYVGQALASS